MLELHLNTPALRRRALTICTSVIGAATALAQPPPTVGPRIVVSPGPADTSVREVDVAGYQDEYSNTKLVAVWMSGPDIITTDLLYAVSTDGGVSWTENPDPIATGRDPTITVADDGTFVVAYLASLGIEAAVMPPCTDQFGDLDCDDNTDPVDPSDIPKPRDLDFPRIASGPDDMEDTKYYVTTWAGNVLFFSTSTDPAAPIDPWPEFDEIEISGSSVPGRWAWPAVTADTGGGSLYVAYSFEDQSGPESFWFYRLLKSDDFGDTFVHVNTPGDFLNEEYHPSGTAGGSNFRAYVPGEFDIAPFVNLVAHPTDENRLYIVFNDCVNCPDPPGSDDADMDVFVMRSTDAGETWGDRVRVNRDVVPPVDPEHVDQWMPRITVTAAHGLIPSRIHVSWYDTRNDPRAADDPLPFEIEAYYAWANDDNNPPSFDEVSLGVAIETGNLIDDTFLGDYNGLTHAGNSLVVPVFMGTHQCCAYVLDEEIVCHRIIH